MHFTVVNRFEQSSAAQRLIRKMLQDPEASNKRLTDVEMGKLKTKESPIPVFKAKKGSYVLLTREPAWTQQTHSMLNAMVIMRNELRNAKSC